MAQRKRYEAKSYKDLLVWQQGHEFVLFIYTLSKKFPKEEVFGLTSQIRRAAVSITSNIAEGFGRSGKKDKAMFYRNSKAPLFEVDNQLTIAKDLEYITSFALSVKLQFVIPSES